MRDRKQIREAIEGVLAVVEVDVVPSDLGCRVTPPVEVPADAPERVTVAVLTGGIAGIVEREARRVAFAEHACDQDNDCNCGFAAMTGEPYAHPGCTKGECLAAAVRAAQ